MTRDEAKRAQRAERLLLKAIHGLPEREQRSVLEYLLRRALSPPSAAVTPTVWPPPPGPMPVPTAVVEGLGSVAAGMLYTDRGVADLAALYAMTEEAVREAIRAVVARTDAPDPQGAFLRLISEGRSGSEARKELKLSQRELETVRGRPEVRKLELLIGKALLTKSYHRDQASAAVRALGAGAPPTFGPPAGAPASLAGGHQMVPVRFPEAQYQRLKDWCAEHGFSMAVVVRGLVERFLEEQERRAA